MLAVHVGECCGSKIDSLFTTIKILETWRRQANCIGALGEIGQSVV